MDLNPEVAFVDATNTARRMHTPEGRRKSGRARISNNGHGSLLPINDGRSLWARIRRDVFLSITNGLLGGTASETQLLIARRVSTLEAELIFMEDSFAAARAAGNEPDMNKLDLFGRLADRQRRLAEPLGWERKQREVQSLGEYLRSKQIEASPAEVIE
jgi:hypothetical protein